MSNINLDSVITEIKFLKEKTPTLPEVLEYLTNNNNIGQGEKSLIYSWFMPKPIIKDKELPSLLKSEVTDNGKFEVMLGAWKSEQYHRYILHLFIAFIVNGKTSHFISKQQKPVECGITGKTLYDMETFQKGLCDKESIGITNSYNNQTDQVLSLEGISLLGRLYNFLLEIDPDFITKR